MAEPSWDDTTELVPSWDDTAEKPWLEAGPLTIKKSPMDVDWLGAAGHEFTKELDPSAKAALENPLMGAFSPAVGAAGVAGAARAGGMVRNAAEGLATSPIPEVVANATNVVGKTKGLAERLAGAIGEKLPAGMKAPLDWATEVAGRHAAYSNPVTGIPQGISDTANVASKAQKGLAWALDKVPAGATSKVAGPAAAAGVQAMIGRRDSTDPVDLLSKARGTRFEKQLRDSLQRGKDSYRATVFMLGQQYPEFRELTGQTSQTP